MESVRRALAVSWALGTSIGVFLGLFGVQLVTSGITGGRTPPLSRPDVLQALEAGRAEEAPEASAVPATTAPPASADTGPDSPLPGPVSPPASTPPASVPPRPGAPAGTAAPPPAPPAPPAAPAPPPAPPAPPAVTSPPPAPPAPKGETRTISSRGGTVAVAYESGRVRLLWARPNDGFDVAVFADGPHEVDVRFRDRGFRSRVRAFYEDGRPAEEVVEQGGPGRTGRPARDARGG